MAQSAIIKFQGHQYIISSGQRLRVDRVAGKDKGDTVVCNDVYCVFEDDSINLGTPVVKGASVVFSVVRNMRGRKVITFKYRPKARSRVKKGFKPEYTEVIVSEIKA